MIKFVRPELFTFDLGKNIKELRLQHKLSQQQLAAKIFEQQKTISNWESNKLTPSLDQLDLLCNVFDVDINELIYGNLNRRHVYIVTEQYNHKKDYIQIKPIIKKAINNYITNKYKNNKKHHYGLEYADWIELQKYYEHMKYIKKLKQQNKLLPDCYVLNHFPKDDEYIITESLSLFQLVSFINSYLSFIEMRKEEKINLSKRIIKDKKYYTNEILELKKQLKTYKIESYSYKDEWKKDHIQSLREHIASYKHNLKCNRLYQNYINDWNISFIEYLFKEHYRPEGTFNHLPPLFYYSTNDFNKSKLQLSITKINKHLNSQIA